MSKDVFPNVKSTFEAVLLKYLPLDQADEVSSVLIDHLKLVLRLECVRYIESKTEEMLKEMGYERRKEGI